MDTNRLFFFFFIHFHICWFACIRIECVMFPFLSACIYCITKIIKTTKNISYRKRNTNKLSEEKGTYLTSHTARSAICD